jgi:DNA-binding winged helix-turn-helix (wHTH) protein
VRFSLNVTVASEWSSATERGWGTTKVLEVLVHKSSQPVSRDDIFDYVWVKDKTPNLRSVDNIIVRLRQLLGDGDGQRIRSVRGLGYQWAPQVVAEGQSTEETSNE